jgi:hypothetical protein
MLGTNYETCRRISDDLVAISWYTASFLNGRITTSDYVDILDKQVHCMVQMFFHNSDAVFQDDSSPIHTAIGVQSWLQKHEDALHYLPWPA